MKTHLRYIQIDRSIDKSQLCFCRQLTHDSHSLLHIHRYLIKADNVVYRFPVSCIYIYIYIYIYEPCIYIIYEPYIVNIHTYIHTRKNCCIDKENNLFEFGNLSVKKTNCFTKSQVFKNIFKTINIHIYPLI